MLEKLKLSFDISSITLKTNIEFNRKRKPKIPQKLIHDHYWSAWSFRN